MSYVQSDKVKEKEINYYEHLKNNNPGEFSSQYKDKADATLADIESTKAFEYNPALDIGYQAAKKQYTQSGKQAMKDTLGAATELTGGYDNSYAQTAAQQTYNQYMAELAALMPQYEQQAYGRWQDDRTAKVDYYTMLRDAEDRAYAQHQDKVNAYNAETDRLYGEMMDEKQLDYGIYQDQVANDQWERTFAHNTAMDNASAAAAQTSAQADYYSALAEYSDDLEGEDQSLFTYSGVNGDGKAVFYQDGKEYVYDVGINPYTGKMNPDAENGTFNNGYQPDNVGGVKLKESGYESDDNGVMQNIYTTGDGRYWLWNGVLNKYEQVPDPTMQGKFKRLGSDLGSALRAIKK